MAPNQYHAIDACSTGAIGMRRMRFSALCAFHAAEGRVAAVYALGRKACGDGAGEISCFNPAARQCVCVHERFVVNEVLGAGTSKCMPNHAMLLQGVQHAGGNAVRCATGGSVRRNGERECRKPTMSRRRVSHVACWRSGVIPTFTVVAARGIL